MDETSRSLKTTRRLFIGSFLAGRERERISSLSPEPLIHAWRIKVKPLKPEKLHLTWLFLGDLNAAQEQLAVEILQDKIALDSTAINQVYDKLEIFPSARKPRLLALTPSAVEPGVPELSRRIRKELGKLCQKDEGESFRPHITVMRLDRQFRGKLSLPDGFPPGNILPVSQCIDEVCLIRSFYDLGQDHYEVVASTKLPPP